MKKIVLVFMMMFMMVGVLVVPAFAADCTDFSVSGASGATTEITCFKPIQAIGKAITGLKTWVMGFAVAAGIFAIAWQAVLMLMQSNDQQVVEQGKKKMRFIAIVTIIVAAIPYILSWMVGFFFGTEKTDTSKITTSFLNPPAIEYQIKTTERV